MSSEEINHESQSPRRTNPQDFFRRAFEAEATSKRQNTTSLYSPISTESSRSAPIVDEKSCTVSPVSPEFDTITELPSPVVNEYIQRPGKKTYGSLSIRPSSTLVSTQKNRITSEYQPITLVENKSNVTSNLDARLAALKDPKRRTVSTPLEEQPASLEREKTSDGNANANQEVIYAGYDDKNVLHKWKHIKLLGKGTFSTVVLGQSVDATDYELSYIAVKIVELPSHKETRSRVESSLSRELELLRLIKHPSIITLLALLVTESKYFMFTPFCEGGDLFELASKYRSKLSPKIIQKMFAEVATAISYLHDNNIVHRDIKLENVLVNHKLEKLLAMGSFTEALITVTDFGLSRKIDPNEPLLTTRCGSEDYVPPELLIGLPYDGRQTDSWAMGVLLYAVMEGRLPFDPPPNKSIRARSRVAHRIARIEWCWNEFSEENKGITWNEDDWAGAKFIVENLLVRREKRISAAEVCAHPWVKECI